MVTSIDTNKMWTDISDRKTSVKTGDKTGDKMQISMSISVVQLILKGDYECQHVTVPRCTPSAVCNALCILLADLMKPTPACESHRHMPSIGSLRHLPLNRLPLQAESFSSLHPGCKDIPCHAHLHTRATFSCNCNSKKSRVRGVQQTL